MAKVTGSAVITSDGSEHHLSLTVEVQPEAPGEYENFKRFLSSHIFKDVEGKFIVSETFDEIVAPCPQPAPPAEPPAEPPVATAAAPDEPAEPSESEVNSALSQIEKDEPKE